MQGAFVALAATLILCSLVRVIWPGRWAASTLETGQLHLTTAALVLIALGGRWPRDAGLGIQILLASAWMVFARAGGQKRRPMRGEISDPPAKTIQRGHTHIWAEAVRCAVLVIIIARAAGSDLAASIICSTALAVSVAITASIRLERRKDSATISEWLASRQPTPPWPGQS
jgi:hypothetical protein